MSNNTIPATNIKLSNTQISNNIFLAGIFKSQANQAHVSVFHEDPNDIQTQEQKMRAWAGGPWENLHNKFHHGGNQYFTISLFKTAEDGRARRRKSLFIQTNVIVVDDVGDGPSAKVNPADARLLPPSFKVATSPGNEQWGYILGFPEMNRHRVENLLEGMVLAGIADGDDPGMLGVTRYVRLPAGTNNKNKYVAELGGPFACHIAHWEPSLVYSMEDLAKPFGIDLSATRGDKEGISVNDETHPGLVAYGAQYGVKSKLDEGRYDVTCPNVHDHTDGDDSGTAIWTYPDGRLGFKCHHGHCEDLSGGWLMNQLYTADPNLEAQTILYNVGFKGGPITDVPITLENDTGEVLPSFITGPKKSQDTLVYEALKQQCDSMAFGMSMDDMSPILVGVAGQPEMIRSQLYTIIKDKTNINIPSIRGEVEKLRSQIMPERSAAQSTVSQEYFHIKTQHKFYDRRTGLLISPEALNQSWAGSEDKAQQEFKETGGVSLDGITWQPTPYGSEVDEIVRIGQAYMVNSYVAPTPIPSFLGPQDIGPYLEHLAYLLPEEGEREAILMHMAFTMQHPEMKIQWHPVVFGDEGTGKDTILYPMAEYFGTMYQDIGKGDVDSGWGDSFAKKKVLTYQEVYRPRDKDFINDVKTKASSTASGRLTLNLKGKGQLEQENLFSLYMFSNHPNPIHITKGDRRWFVTGDMSIKPNPVEYYDVLYHWLDNQGGCLSVAYYLLNMDISQFNPNRMPFSSEARESIIQGSKSDTQLELESALVAESGIFDVSKSVVSATIAAKYLKKLGYRNLTDTRLGRELKSMKLMSLTKLDKTRAGVRYLVNLYKNPNYSGDIDFGNKDVIFAEFQGCLNSADVRRPSVTGL